MAASNTENTHFLSLFFQSKGFLRMINWLVALGTAGGQEIYSLVAFHCPCTPVQNYLYGLAATGVPALVLFFIGIMLNIQTWKLLSECRYRKSKNGSIIHLLSSIVCHATIAPVTWLVISLLRGEAYVCAFSEFVDPSLLKTRNEGFPLPHATQILARFPCKESPANLSSFQVEVIRRLQYESQLFGWLLIGTVTILVFAGKCLKYKCSSLGYRQRDYWARYLTNEKQLFQRTAEAHSRMLAAKNVKSFFGFVELSKEDKELMEKHKDLVTPPCKMWNKITGIYMSREIKDCPIYSRLHKWVWNQSNNGKDAEEKRSLLSCCCPTPATHQSLPISPQGESELQSGIQSSGHSRL